MLMDRTRLLWIPALLAGFHRRSNPIAALLGTPMRSIFGAWLPKTEHLKGGQFQILGLQINLSKLRISRVKIAKILTQSTF